MSSFYVGEILWKIHEKDEGRWRPVFASDNEQVLQEMMDYQYPNHKTRIRLAAFVKAVTIT